MPNVVGKYILLKYTDDLYIFEWIDLETPCKTFYEEIIYIICFLECEETTDDKFETVTRTKVN